VDSPDLITPVRFDIGRTTAELAKLAAAGKKAGNDTQDAAKKATKSIGDLGGSIASAARALGAIGTANEVVGAVRDRTKECSDYVGRVSKDFIELRRAMQQVATQTGKHSNNELTVEQTHVAAKAIVTLQERTKFREQFQSYAGSYLEGDQQRQDGKRAEEYQRKIAEFSNARGTQSEKAAQFVALASKTISGEEETGTTNFLEALTNAKLERRRAKFGLETGVTPLEEVKGMAGPLPAPRDADDDLEKVLKDFSPNTREWREVLGILNRGVKGGGFDRMGRYATQSSVTSMDEAINAHEGSASGAQTRSDADEALAMARASSNSIVMEALRQVARTALSREGSSEQFEAHDFGRSSIGKIRGLTIEDQSANQRVLENPLDRSALNGPGLSRREETVEGTSQVHPGATNRFVQDSLRRLLEFEEEKARQRNSPPISAPPPTAPNDGRMGATC
jgi:hypothetical protein